MGQGKNSDKLSRGTALTILNDNSQELLGEDDYWSIAAFVTVAEEPQHRMGREFETQYLEFLNTLAEEGIFRREPNRDTVHRDFERNDGTARTYQFSVLERADVEQTGTSGEPKARFRISSRKFNRVTGISQEGSTALVDAEILRMPTPVHKKLSGALAITRVKIGNPQFMLTLAPQQPGLTSSIIAAMSQGPGPHFPGSETMERPTLVQVRFQKYDDGWRLVGPMIMKTR
jgi:hypothetical protein